MLYYVELVLRLALLEPYGDGRNEAARNARLLKIIRMTRLVRAFPSLVTLLHGITIAMQSVATALLLLMFFTYFFSLGLLRAAMSSEVGISHLAPLIDTSCRVCSRTRTSGCQSCRC